MRLFIATLIAALLFLRSLPVIASDLVDTSISDTQKVDAGMSDELVTTVVEGTKGSFAFIPIPISNPTIGTGLGAVAMYMHPKAAGDKSAPTSSTGVFGMYTSTESWAAGVFHDGYYRQDRIRFKMPVGHGSINLKFYGIGSESPLRNNPISYNAKGTFTMPRLLFRLPANHWFLGGQYRFLNINIATDLGGRLPISPGTGIETQTSGLGAVTVYDSRNSNYWPTEGSWLDGAFTLYSEAIGGDYDYQKLILKWAQYFPLSDKWLAVYRLDGQLINDDAPFWDLSQITLRGYAADQYLDKTAITAQAEVRWNFYKRWTAVAFGGLARVADTIWDINNSKTLPAGGGGIHFMLKEAEKLSIGIDVAKGEGESVTVYFQIGDWMAK